MTARGILGLLLAACVCSAQAQPVATADQGLIAAGAR
jgi:hypothetical protein